jgi:hypothetical protein
MAEASAARECLKEAFTHYNTVANRICSLPCERGSSQNRVHMAICSYRRVCPRSSFGYPPSSIARPYRDFSSIFVVTSQTNTQNKLGVVNTLDTHTLALNKTTINPDSELAHTLQSLLEQEVLLETFVQEATLKRQF